jgi:pimeloyl-ACP methyl ester carboxylesterase
MTNADLDPPASRWEGTRTMALAEVSLEVEILGAGEPVLLLHGFPTTRALWAAVAPALAAAGHRVIMPDLAGYGGSVAAPGLRIDMASQARWLLELLDRLEIARAAVIAHDVGSAAAQLLVAQAPARARALVVIDGVFRDEWAMDAVQSIRDWRADPARLHPVLARKLGQPLREVLAGYAGEAGGRQLIRAARDLEPQQTADLDEALRASGVPALVVWGDRDAYLPLDLVARPLAELLAAKLHILPGGHFLPLDNPAGLATLLAEFLATVSAKDDVPRR